MFEHDSVSAFGLRQPTNKFLSLKPRIIPNTHFSLAIHHNNLTKVQLGQGPCDRVMPF